MKIADLGNVNTKLKEVKSITKNKADAMRRFFGRVKITPVDVAVAVSVLILSLIVIVPSIFSCITNRSKAACEQHMYRMLGVLSDELAKESENGGTYWKDLIVNGNYQKLLTSLNYKTGEKKKYSPSDYYIRTGQDTISIVCKRHKDISEKELRFSAMQNINVSVAEKPVFGEKIVYLAVTGPDTYYQNDSFDSAHPGKMVFTGREVDDIIQNLRVYAVYMGGYKEELTRSKYTITTDRLDMSKAGQTHLIIKYNPTSVWDNSAYVPFVIDVIGKDDVAPLIVDAGINGKFELASWEWNDYLEEASEKKDGKEFDASIIRYGDKYYYYPDGLYIGNSGKNTSPLKYALNIDDHSVPAYCIAFDTNSVILNSGDEKKIHEGSLKVENDLVYIWQDQPSKELDSGWIRVYCELRKY